MIGHLRARFGLAREEGYVAASVAVDLRLAEVVNRSRVVPGLILTSVFVT